MGDAASRRPLIDTTAPSPFDVEDRDRDDAWATPMEQVVARHAQANLSDFLPDAAWVGVDCRTSTCTLEFTIDEADRTFAAVVTPFVAGPFTLRRSHRPGADGRETVLATVSYLDLLDGARVDPSQFDAAFAVLPKRYVEWRERIRADPAAAKAELAASASGRR